MTQGDFIFDIKTFVPDKGAYVDVCDINIGGREPKPQEPYDLHITFSLAIKSIY